MYAAVYFTDYRKENRFEVLESTSSVEYAKKLAFQFAKKELSRMRNTEKSVFKITTKTEEYEYEYLHPLNKIILAYKIIELVKYKKGLKIVSSNTSIYAVFELDKTEITENLDEIEPSLICDKYYSYNHCDSDSDSD
jgi:AAA15 family ATPase/GTPase